jgi:hypothetical protein
MANNASAGPDGNSLFLTASPSRADEIFLEEPRSRIREFITLVRVMRDFVRGFRVLHLARTGTTPVTSRASASRL